MSFHFGMTETILFDFWNTTEIGGFLGSIILIFFMGVAYEALKFFREFLQVQYKRRHTSYGTLQPLAEDGSRPCPARAVVQPK